jgi:hypothetical protein
MQRLDSSQPVPLLGYLPVQAATPPFCIFERQKADPAKGRNTPFAGIGFIFAYSVVKQAFRLLVLL